MNKPKQTKTAAGGSRRRGVGISAKLVFAVIVSAIIAVSALLAVVYNRMSQTLLEKSEEILRTTADKTLQETKAWMNQTLTMLQTQRDTIQYEDMDIPQMKKYIKHTAGKNDAYPAGLYVALTDGSLYHASFVPGPDFNALVKSWYLDGLDSENFILGDVYFDEDSQSYVVGASGVLKDGKGKVRGVAAADVYLNSISDIVSNIKIEDTGGIFLVDTRTDTIIGHRDEALVGEKLSETDGMYSYAEKQIQAGKMGLNTYKNNYIEIAEVPGSSWAAVAYVSRTEVLSELNDLTQTMVKVSVIAILVLTLLVVIQIRRIIGKPVKELNLVATRIAEGNLEQTIRYKSRDELGILADNFNQVTIRLRDYIQYINEISDTLHEIAKGNLTFKLQNDYTGEFAKIKESLDEIAVELNTAIGQMSISSKDVAAGAAQISDSAVILSQGSTEQAAEVESLAGHIGKASDSVQNIAQSTQKASSISREVRGGLLESNTKMQNMTKVIKRISEKSNAINKIVKTIDDIAFQTNILALNAAVEAARAGEAGKGFAVVAQEVRTLASRSANAAKETTELLGETINSMEEGVSAADETAQAILAAAGMAEEMDSLIGNIADNAQQQAVTAEEISHGIEQISIVVQRNVSSAQSSAAASEELSSQAATLRDLVSKFRLKNE
ncbi:MAG: methyl-accepting chemotaxis protein [Lachnospiraceae bacterium]|nr:methyl-accepting chemotaxis protein [Lachnospiraceae bacterium]